MLNERSSLTTLGLAAAALVASTVFLVVPQYRAAASIRERTAKTEERLTNRADEERTLRQLGEEVAEWERQLAGLRTIPDSPAMADLIGMLTVPVDDLSVLDQEFNSGAESPVAQVPDGSIIARPLTIDMVGSFDTLFGLIRDAEGIDRLVRVASVRLERNRDNPELIDGTIELHAIFAAKAEGAH